MQDIKLSAATTLMDQSMSPYHAGEDAFFGARVNYGKEALFCSLQKFTQISFINLKKKVFAYTNYKSHSRRIKILIKKKN